MKIPDIDLEELRKFKEENFKQRLEFIKKYAKWVREKENIKWSSQQREIID